MKICHRLLQVTLLAMCAAAISTFAETPSPSVLTIEPRNDAEAQMQNKYLDKIKPEEYAKWVAYVESRPAEEQVWLRTLEAQLGSFYAPPYMKDLVLGKVDPATDGWAYVKDDPKLPRVLIIGDSISRSYTAPVRIALQGKANVHRAPANCGRTENFFKFGEVWLMQNGSNKWDLITVNFGIHDASKKPEDYAANLRKIVARLRETGAKIIWVKTTPWGKKEDEPGLDRSIPLNQTADAVAKELGLPIIDVHSVVSDKLATLQAKDRTHFINEGPTLLGKAVAAAIEPVLAPVK